MKLTNKPYRITATYIIEGDEIAEIRAIASRLMQGDSLDYDKRSSLGEKLALICDWIAQRDVPPGYFLPDDGK